MTVRAATISFSHITCPARWLEIPLLASILLFIFCTGIQDIPFHPDESQWIATSGAFEAYVSGDFASPTWNETLWTLTQPPGTRYIIALGRLAGGYHADQLNVPWSFGRDEPTNIAAGAMPSPGLLWWSRLPMALVSVVSMLLLFRLVSATAGRIAGYMCLLLVTSNPFMLMTLRRAMAEAPLLLCLMLAACTGAYALYSLRHTLSHATRSRWSLLQPLLWFTLMGMFTGVAGTMKLNGLAALTAVIGLWVLAMLMLTSERRNLSQPYVIILGCVLILVVTFGIFVALNPYLYPDMLGRTIKLFQFRLHEMQKQQAALPDFVFQNTSERFQVTFAYLFQHTSVIHFSGAGVINLLLCTVGIYQLTSTAWRSLRGGTGPGTSSVIILIAIVSAGPMLLTPLNWDRYFLLPMLFSTICIAIGFAWSIHAAHRLVVAWFATSPSDT